MKLCLSFLSKRVAVSVILHNLSFFIASVVNYFHNELLMFNAAFIMTKYVIRHNSLLDRERSDN